MLIQWQSHQCMLSLTRSSDGCLKGSSDWGTKGFVGAVLSAVTLHVLDLAAESESLHSSGIGKWLDSSKMVLSCVCAVVLKCSWFAKEEKEDIFHYKLGLNSYETSMMWSIRVECLVCISNSRNTHLWKVLVLEVTIHHKGQWENVHLLEDLDFVNAYMYLRPMLLCYSPIRFDDKFRMICWSSNVTWFAMKMCLCVNHDVGVMFWLWEVSYIL